MRAPARVPQVFLPTDKVRKTSGYPFDGEVRARFMTKAGKTRYVVEAEATPGLLHIFNGEQLELREPMTTGNIEALLAALRTDDRSPWSLAAAETIEELLRKGQVNG